MDIFLRYVRQIMNQLQDSLPHIADEWMEIENALAEYQTTLKDSQSPSFRHFGKSSPSSDGSSLNNAWTPVADQVQDLNNQKFSAGTHTDGLTEPVSFHHNQHHHVYVPESQTSTASSPKKEKLPGYVVRTLSGWLYFGQAIADTFNIYTQVFVVLSIAAQHYSRYVIRSL
jgi:hypothetical protein